ncbi:DEAD/DEAH box helicase family protein [Chryseobacterium sp. WG23]|uniref:DEAD/DEAH box helicase family protein n=1 Tax=Chryseobacterium sp. WG23 TaxID=2926910 RepID=UPI00211E5473|nr:DEAD/DEAH box helicase family protein [Chryseobacterium sp. WG23]MCQ9635066.1 DEAD/DEAH box helicase family protein [Chryseobacterium sp. WG23]
MELPNKHFQDFPIEFKEINPEDFISVGFDVDNKVIIEPNDDGYIFDALKDTMSISEKNTVVVNAPVGYGKSYAIIKLIKAIYEIKPKSKIIVATPFVSLVEQYVTDINQEGNVPSQDIYSYSNLGRNKKETYKNKRVHVLTVNTLLGNPGEDGFKNSDAKRLYIDNLIGESVNDSSEVFFIYDEIHDSIQNFKEEFMLYLWKWKDVIHKNIILSATYNEASKVVIKYLAELTDMKIQIIESVRRIFPEKQSQLYLHYSTDYNFKLTTNELVNVVDDLLKRNRNIDILSYSKSLAKSIIKDKDGIGKKLKDRFGTLNDCTSELLYNQRPENEPPKNRYKNDMCNIGTNFKTGVSIKKDNHSFIIILPPRGARLFFKNLYGIFSNGTNDIIQALARQRTKGEIHIILPRPDEFDFESLKKTAMSKEQKTKFEEHYSKIKHTNPEEKSPVKYIALNKQNDILHNFYHKTLYGFVVNEDLEVNKTKRNTSLPRLEYPPFEIWKLNKGEQYLANEIKFFGEDLSAYVTYCAFTNQFINCTLTEVNEKGSLLFDEGKIQQQLSRYFDEHFGIEYFRMKHIYSNFSMFYEDLKREFFNNFQMQLKEKKSDKYSPIKPGANRIFEIQFLLFIHKLYQGYGSTLPIENNVDYTRSEYLLDCIVSATSLDFSNSKYSGKQKARIKAFQDLGSLREKMIQAIQESSKTPKFRYLPTKPSDDFKTLEDIKLIENIMTVLGEDSLFQNDIFLLRRNLVNKNNVEKKIESIYKALINDFFILSDETHQVKVNGKNQGIHTIEKIIELPESSTINLLLTSDFDEVYTSVVEEFILQIPKSVEDNSSKYKTTDEYYADMLNRLQE